MAVRVAYPEGGEYSWTEALRPFSALGAVEVAFRSPQLFLNEVEIRDVVSPFSKLPVQAATIHMAHAPITEPEIFARTLEKTVRIAKELECPLIVVHPSRGRPPQVEEFFAQRIDPLLERAGALLCWETFESKRRFLSGIEGIAAFCLCRGRGWHGACYDTSHLLKPQEEVLRDIQTYASVIKCFHLSNRAGGGGRGELEQHLPLRHPEGELDFEEVLRVIRESGFLGALTLEYLKEHHDRLVEDALWVEEQLKLR